MCEHIGVLEVPKVSSQECVEAVIKTENFIESSSQIDKTWINTAQDRGRWTPLEDKYTMTAEERHENNATM